MNRAIKIMLMLISPTGMMFEYFTNIILKQNKYWKSYQIVFSNSTFIMRESRRTLHFIEKTILYCLRQ